MQYTTHFNLNLPEGTDIVNPLVQDNPNYSAIDAAMFANKQAVIGTASEVVSGTVHAITRSNTDSDYFRFTATGNWTAGDSMSVDGTTVSVYLSDGTTPATGAYIINTEVLALLSGTRVTLIISNGVAASEIGTLSNLTTTDKSNLVDAINEVNGSTKRVIATSAANQAIAAQLSELATAYAALTNEEKIHTALLRGTNIYRCVETSLGLYSRFVVGATNVASDYYQISGTIAREYNGNTIYDVSTNTNPLALELVII